MFLATDADIGIVDELGFLRYRSNVHVADRGIPAASIPQPSGGEQRPEQQVGGMVSLQRHFTMPAETGNAATSGAPAYNVWTYSEAGGNVRLETADPLPKALWERLTKPACRVR